MVGTLILIILLTPGLLSLARTEPGDENPEPSGLPPTGKPSGTANIRILGVNDFHGHIEEAATLSATLDHYEAQNPEGTIRVHAGDMVGGSPLISSYFHDEPAVYAMKALGFDVGTLGNHEFDEGGGEMLRLLEGGRRDDGEQYKGGENTSDPNFPGAGFPYAAANILWKDSGEPVLAPYRIVERDGLKVGFIGATTKETPEILTETIDEFRFTDISKAVNRQVPELRRRGVETIVVLAHEGGYRKKPVEGRGDEIFAEARQMSGAVDVVVAGHTHNLLDARAGGKLVVTAEEYGTNLDVVDLRVDRATGDVTSSTARVVANEGSFGADGEVARLVAGYRERVAPISNRVVGRASRGATRATTPAGENALGDLVSDAYRSAAGTDFAFVGSGGLRADLDAGPVTYGELYAARPFEEVLVEMELTGAEVRRVLEQQYDGGERTTLQVSGLRFAHDPSRPEGSRVTAVTLPGGAPLDPEATYTVAVTRPLADGGSEFTAFTRGRSVRTVGDDLQILTHYVEEELPRPFEPPDPTERRRITLEG